MKEKCISIVLFMLLVMGGLLFLSGCEYQDNNEIKYEDYFSYTQAYMYVTKRARLYYAFDSSSNKVIQVSKSRGKVSYKEGVYIGDLSSEFDVDTNHFRKKDGHLELISESGDIFNTYSSCDVNDVMYLLKETDYYKKQIDLEK